MKYFKNKTTSTNEGKFKPKFTVGSRFRDDPAPLDDLHAKLESVQLMNKDKIGRLFSPLTGIPANKPIEKNE